MIDQLKCSTCPDHPHTVERLATVEKGMSSVEINMDNVLIRLDKIRDETMKEFRLMRDDITKGILKRYPAWVLVGFSILTGLVGVLGNAYFSK